MTEKLPAVPRVAASRSIEDGGRPYVVELVVLREGHVEANVNDSWCGWQSGSFLLTGRFGLVLRDATSTISQVELVTDGEDDIDGLAYLKGRWRFHGDQPIHILRDAGHRFPTLVAIPRYNSCNGFDYTFVAIHIEGDRPRLAKLRFNACGNAGAWQLYGNDSWMNASASAFPGLWILGYNNAELGNFLENYLPADGEPGLWICVGLYTHQGGLFEDTLRKVRRAPRKP